MVLILSASPNDNGLTAACVKAAEQGIEQGGGQFRTVKLTERGIGSCKACFDGWGTCRNEHFCQVKDGYQALHEECREADALIVVTPVYWGDMAEVAKNFLDRLRRCEALLRAESKLAGKPFLAVAAAGGSGNGTQTCLAQLERFAGHISMKPFDLIPVKRMTRDYQLGAITGAAAELARTLPQG